MFKIDKMKLNYVKRVLRCQPSIVAVVAAFVVVFMAILIPYSITDFIASKFSEDFDRYFQPIYLLILFISACYLVKLMFDVAIADFKEAEGQIERRLKVAMQGRDSEFFSETNRKIDELRDLSTQFYQVQLFAATLKEVRERLVKCEQLFVDVERIMADAKQDVDLNLGNEQKVRCYETEAKCLEALFEANNDPEITGIRDFSSFIEEKICEFAERDGGPTYSPSHNERFSAIYLRHQGLIIAANKFIPKIAQVAHKNLFANLPKPLGK